MAHALRLLAGVVGMPGASASWPDPVRHLLHSEAAPSLQAGALSSAVPLDTRSEPSPIAGSNDTLDLRITAVFVIFAGALLCGLVPICLDYFRHPEALLGRLLRIFSGGVILALALVHIIPDAVEEVAGLVDYPLGGVAVLVGIIMLVVVDNSLAAFFMPRAHKHGRHGQGSLQRHGHAHSREVLLKRHAGDSACHHGHTANGVRTINGHTHMHMDPHMQHAAAFQQQQQQQQGEEEWEQQHDHNHHHHRRHQHEQEDGESRPHEHSAHDVEAAADAPLPDGDAGGCKHAATQHGHHGHAHGRHEVMAGQHAHADGHEDDAHTHQCMRSMSAQHWVSSVASNQAMHARQYVTAYTMELGCIFHSVLIGIGMGVIVNDRRLVATLMIALTVHQGLEGLSLASVLALTPFSTLKKALMLLLYSITTPVGIAVGIAVSSTYDAETRVARGVQGTLNGISGGMLLYIAMYQLIAEEFSREDLLVRTRLRLGMYAALLAGAASMCLLAAWS